MNHKGFSNTVFVTGANRGIGLGFVKHYLQQGHAVLATAVTPQRAQALIALQNAFPKQLSIEALDVTNEEAIAKLAARLKQQNIRIDIAINNAGIAKGEAFGHWTTASFQAHLRVNTIGPALVSQAIVPLLNPGAKLVQVSSGMGSIEWNLGPDNPLDAYAASKCALNILSRRLAEKLHPKGIVVVAINPGWVQTEMGGPNATTPIDEAIQQLTTTIASIQLDHSGRFLDEAGASIPW